MKNKTQKISGFSLVEVLAAVGIIGIISFLAIPNIVAIKEDSERQLAITRAEGLNMATAAYIQANGRVAVAAAWGALGTDAAANEARYDLVSPYLSFAPEDLVLFQPAGYEITLPVNLNSLTKSVLKETAVTDPITY